VARVLARRDWRRASGAWGRGTWLASAVGVERTGCSAAGPGLCARVLGAGQGHVEVSLGDAARAPGCLRRLLLWSDAVVRETRGGETGAGMAVMERKPSPLLEKKRLALIEQRAGP
jgi:hypothetical protein